MTFLCVFLCVWRQMENDSKLIFQSSKEKNSIRIYDCENAIAASFLLPKQFTEFHWQKSNSIRLNYSKIKEHTYRGWEDDWCEKYLEPNSNEVKTIYMMIVELISSSSFSSTEQKT